MSGGGRKRRTQKKRRKRRTQKKRRKRKYKRKRYSKKRKGKKKSRQVRRRKRKTKKRRKYTKKQRGGVAYTSSIDISRVYKAYNEALMKIPSEGGGKEVLEVMPPCLTIKHPSERKQSYLLFPDFMNPVPGFFHHIMNLKWLNHLIDIRTSGIL